MWVVRANVGAPCPIRGYAPNRATGSETTHTTSRLHLRGALTHRPEVAVVPVEGVADDDVPVGDVTGVQDDELLGPAARDRGDVVADAAKLAV